MKSPLPAALRLVVLALTLVAASCADTSEKEIDSLLALRDRAFETKNVDEYMAFIAPDYREEFEGKVLGSADVKKRFMGNISIFDEIRLSPIDRAFYRRGEAYEVFRKVKVRVKVDKEESEFLIQEVIGLDKIGGAWKITKESKADFLGGFVFGDLR